ncbi:MAG: TrkA family potassium uptake protein [Candidatus Limnocylindrales bacterium]|jgi:trk system potassium uptake protein TrkA
MKIVIVGCGRVGSTLAENLDADGHEVIIFDIRTAAFDRLPATFKGAAIRGDGTDEAVLRAGGADGADIFLSLTEGDNRNVMAAQVATESLAIPQVIAKINDPVRAAAYAELGVVTLCRTNLIVDTVAQYLNLPMSTGPGIDTPEVESRRHPHPTASGLPVAPIGEDAESSSSSRAPGPHGGTGEPGSTSPRSVPGKEVDAARTSRLGFPRRRG